MTLGHRSALRQDDETDRCRIRFASARARYDNDEASDRAPVLAVTCVVAVPESGAGTDVGVKLAG